MIGIWRGAKQRIARLKPVRVPDGPARAFRDLWPGDPARGARLLRGEFEVMGTVRGFGGWGGNLGLTRCVRVSAMQVWRIDARIIQRDASRYSLVMLTGPNSTR